MVGNETHKQCPGCEQLIYAAELFCDGCGHDFAGALASVIQDDAPPMNGGLFAWLRSIWQEGD